MRLVCIHVVELKLGWARIVVAVRLARLARPADVLVGIRQNQQRAWCLETMTTARGYESWARDPHSHIHTAGENKIMFIGWGYCVDVDLVPQNTEPCHVT